MSKKIVITVNGGVVTSVYSNDAEIEVKVFDFDSIEGAAAAGVDQFEKDYDESIKSTGISIY